VLAGQAKSGRLELASALARGKRNAGFDPPTPHSPANAAFGAPLVFPGYGHSVGAIRFAFASERR